ncbi:hypothetical protein BBP40_001638 [Aspergillus hancockii]|nr:hypothetical protein BBP40_001638 [Aspergillus hancockii]
MLKNILNKWTKFMKSTKPTGVLDGSEADWLSPVALRNLADAANIGGTTYTFAELFICDPNAQQYGFQSWDEFFTRRFRDSMRPIASPEDDSVIANACESQPGKLARGVEARDSFWIKGTPYSLVDLLGKKYAETFTGSTVYQGYLDIFKYHRWHAPVSGRVVKAFHIDGTYFSMPRVVEQGILNDYPGRAADYSVYLAVMATRAVILIEAENPKIGLMAFLAVGIDEISSCNITVEEGEYVSKGDQLGMFHYGGSSHFLVFREGVNVTGFPEIGRRENLPVRSQVAVVEP